MNRDPHIRRERWRQARRVMEAITVCALVVISYLNFSVFRDNVRNLPPEQSDELVVQEERYKGIRAFLIDAGYPRGPVGFITNRDWTPSERGRPDFIGEDIKRWAQGQYVMVPWTLVAPDGRTPSDVRIPDVTPKFVIGEFWDRVPLQIPDEFVKLYESGSTLVLFQRKSAP